jgi:LAO/AO transport system kinase
MKAPQEERHKKAIKAIQTQRLSHADVKAIKEGILKGERFMLSRGITLIESQQPADIQAANQLVKELLPFAGKSKRIGISGVPGAGKSTFIESFGLYAIEHKAEKIAVLTVDPSSLESKGSILGDKTRMSKLSSHPNAFVRPTPSGGALGGVARKTRETVYLCEAAGYSTILVETVGVGQSETAVSMLTDMFILIAVTGAGDELQGIKRGIMELCDVVFVNKADGDNEQKALIASKEIKRALHYFLPPESGWTPQSKSCSSLTGKGIAEAWEEVESYFQLIQNNQYLNENRSKQMAYWLRQTVMDNIEQLLTHTPKLQKMLFDSEEAIEQGRETITEAAMKILHQLGIKDR